MKLIVIACWLLAIAYVPFHFRKTASVRQFFRGFGHVWLSLLYADDLTHDPEDDWIAYDKGCVAGFFSILFAIIGLLTLAAITIYLA